MYKYIVCDAGIKKNQMLRIGFVPLAKQFTGLFRNLVVLLLTGLRLCSYCVSQADTSLRPQLTIRSAQSSSPVFFENFYRAIGAALVIIIHVYPL